LQYIWSVYIILYLLLVYVFISSSQNFLLTIALDTEKIIYKILIVFSDKSHRLKITFTHWHFILMFIVIKDLRNLSQNKLENLRKQLQIVHCKFLRKIKKLWEICKSKIKIYQKFAKMCEQNLRNKKIDDKIITFLPDFLMKIANRRY